MVELYRGTVTVYVSLDLHQLDPRYLRCGSPYRQEMAGPDKRKASPAASMSAQYDTKSPDGPPQNVF